jgi:hypothetical protein
MKEKVHVIPVLAGGTVEHWANLRDLQSLTYEGRRSSELLAQVLEATRQRSAATR